MNNNQLKETNINKEDMKNLEIAKAIRDYEKKVNDNNTITKQDKINNVRKILEDGVNKW